MVKNIDEVLAEGYGNLGFPRVIIDDDDVLKYSQLFEIEDVLKKYLAERTEATIIKTISTNKNKNIKFVFCVHALEGDDGYSCLITSDNDTCKELLTDFIKHRIETTGIKHFTCGDDVPGIDVIANS